MKHLYLFSVLLLSAWATVQAAPLEAGKAGVYGELTAEENSVVKEKRQQSNVSSSPYDSPTQTSETVSSDELVNYANLDDLYVGLVVPTLATQQHIVNVSAQGISPRALAVAVGDSLQVFNDTAATQSLFLTQTINSGEGIQTFPSLAAGSSATYSVQLAGDLELLAENDGNLKARLLSKKNMQVKRLSSGDSYQFENLQPGEYNLIFWHWRLGKIEQKITLNSGDNLRVDKTLSVDSIMRSR